MATIFTKIVNGEIPAYKVAETDNFLAFLDIHPQVKGHTLCIPKKEVDYLFDLDDETYLGLHAFSREVARALEKTVPCNRIATAVIGLEVPHAHVHLMPINNMADFGFGRGGVQMNAEEMEELAAQIRANIVNM
ncbi:MAG: HIT family protein [Bacteroidia bacterium]|nr:HIT family protein [Bacteroidia bacterium]